MTKLSVVIITLNEEKNIGRCLESVKNIADEILVVDSFSTDKTESICKFYNARFVKNKFRNYIEQKNLALNLASNSFILSIDADEALSEGLIQSIQKVKDNKKYDSYSMKRMTNYCGKWIKHGGWYPDKKIRLFDRNKCFWGGPNPHETLILKENTTTLHLKGDILHYSYYTFFGHLKQIALFTNIASNELFKKNKKATVIKLVLNPVHKFFKYYILKLGFLDGPYGYKIARMSAYTTFLKYKKLRKLYK